MSKSTETIIVSVIMVAIVVYYLMAALAPFYQHAIEDEEEAERLRRDEEYNALEDFEGVRCPYCCRTAKRDHSGDPSCNCHDFMAANDMNQCKIHGIVFYGSTCPKCSGSNNWED